MALRTVKYAVAGILSLLVASGAGAADLGLLGPDIRGAGWNVLGVPGKRETSFRMNDEGALQIEAVGAVAFLYKEIDQSGDQLHWRWQVLDMGPPSDLYAVGRDDRPMAIHLWFPTEENNSTIFGGMAELFGFPRVGHALTYVWGGAADAPRLTSNPYMPEGRGAIIVLRTEVDKPNVWMDERVDFQADYREAFGEAAPLPTHIAISGDSDDLGGVRRGQIGELRFGLTGTGAKAEMGNARDYPQKR